MGIVLFQLEGDGGSEGGFERMKYGKQLGVLRDLSVVDLENCRSPFVWAIDENISEGTGLHLYKGGLHQERADQCQITLKVGDLTGSRRERKVL
jgi:hypothetical protein